MSNIKRWKHAEGNRKNKPLTDDADVWNSIHHAVESGKATTPAQLLSMFNSISKKVAYRIGYSINKGLWEIDGVVPNNKRKSKHGPENDTLGNFVLSNSKHANSKIEVLKEFSRRSVPMEASALAEAEVEKERKKQPMATPKMEQYWRMDDMLMTSPSGVTIGDLRKATAGGALRANTRTASWLLNDNALIDGFLVRKPSVGTYNQWKTDGTRARLIERVAKVNNNAVVKYTGKPPRRRNASMGSRILSRPSHRPIAPAENFSGELQPDEGYIEGAISKVVVNRYERDPKARAACLERYGCKCSVCNFDFEERYGGIGYGFIHVHHLKPLSLRKAKYRLDPTKDLVTVCPNCHAMLHTSDPPIEIDELREIWVRNGGL